PNEGDYYPCLKIPPESGVCVNIQSLQKASERAACYVPSTKCGGAFGSNNTGIAVSSHLEWGTPTSSFLENHRTSKVSSPSGRLLPRVIFPRKMVPTYAARSPFG